MGIEEKIQSMLEPSVQGLGHNIVRVHVSRAPRRPVVQIMIERQDARSVTMEDCTIVSKTASAILDVADPLPAAYVLEVTSPGLDRPLISKQDYERFQGNRIRLHSKQPIDGRKKFEGTLGLSSEDDVTLHLDSGSPIQVRLDNIQGAKLAPDFSKG